MKSVAFVVIAGVLAFAGIAHAERGAHTKSGEVHSCVAFSTIGDSDVRGRGELISYRRSSELGGLRLRRMEPATVHIFWLKPRHRDGHWVGGAIKSDRRGSFRGSAVIPGSAKVAERHVTKTRSVLVTSNSEAEAREISERYRESDWKRRGQPVGSVVARGKLFPPKKQSFWDCAPPG